MAHHRVKLADHLEKKNKEGRIVVELSDGSTVTVPPPSMFPDDLVDDLEAGRFQASTIGPRIVGEDDWAKLAAEGLTGTGLMELIEEKHGASLGE